MLMGPIFVLVAYHTFFVASPLAVGAAPWILMAGASAVGLLAWGQTLLRKVTPSRLVTVESATAFDGGLDVTFRSGAPLKPFRAGQFATVAHNRARAEAHPFTIAGGDETARRFVIRAAGDWTKDFVRNVKPGNKFRLGRGVGRFLPQTGVKRKEQLWVAGGVGITPFLAALEQMQPDSGARITLTYCIRSQETAGVINDIEAHAARLQQVDLIVLSDIAQDFLTPERLTDIVREMKKETEVYLCGPEGLKSLVTRIWKTVGMPGRIHSERFDFRGAYGLNDLIYIGKPVVDVARRLIQSGKENAHASTGS